MIQDFPIRLELISLECPRRCAHNFSAKFQGEKLTLKFDMYTSLFDQKLFIRALTVHRQKNQREGIILFFDSCRPDEGGVQSATQTVIQTRIECHLDTESRGAWIHLSDWHWGLVCVTTWNEPSIPLQGGVGSSSV